MKTGNAVRLLGFMSLSVFSAGCLGAAAVGPVTLQSKPYGAAAAAKVSSSVGLFSPLALTAISGFSFCVTKLKVEAEDGSVIQHEGSDLIDVKLGLIDAGTVDSSLVWGNADIPVGTTIKRIKVEIHQDPELCGGQRYSVRLNGNELTQDLEFVFKFANAKPLAAGETVTFSLDPIINAYLSAFDAGAFSDSLIGSYAEGIEADADGEND